jgi:hypothetical protein
MYKEYSVQGSCVFCEKTLQEKGAQAAAPSQSDPEYGAPHGSTADYRKGAMFRGGRSSLVVLKSGFSLNQFTYKDECLEPLLESLLWNEI